MAELLFFQRKPCSHSATLHLSECKLQPHSMTQLLHIGCELFHEINDLTVNSPTRPKPREVAEVCVTKPNDHPNHTKHDEC